MYTEWHDSTEADGFVVQRRQLVLGRRHLVGTQRQQQGLRASGQKPWGEGANTGKKPLIGPDLTAVCRAVSVVVLILFLF